MKRIALSIALLVGIALPAAAQDNPCVTVTFGEENSVGTPTIESRDYQDGAPSSSIVGRFVWFSWVEDSDFGREETLSFDAASLESATACADGSVSLVEVESDAGVLVPPVAPAPAPSEPVTLRPVCEVHADTLEYVCTLPNLTLRVS
jgi:hypothetical protein